MAKRKFPFDFDDFDDDDFGERPPVPVTELPYYETLRSILEPYRPASSELDADKLYTSAEIIKAIELHHGVPQGLMGKMGIKEFVQPEDFVRVMSHCGYYPVNTGGLGLMWALKNK